MYYLVGCVRETRKYKDWDFYNIHRYLDPELYSVHCTVNMLFIVGVVLSMMKLMVNAVGCGINPLILRLAP